VDSGRTGSLRQVAQFLVLNLDGVTCLALASDQKRPAAQSPLLRLAGIAGRDSSRWYSSRWQFGWLGLLPLLPLRSKLRGKNVIERPSKQKSAIFASPWRVRRFSRSSFRGPTSSWGTGRREPVLRADFRTRCSSVREWQCAGDCLCCGRRVRISQHDGHVWPRSAGGSRQRSSGSGVSGVGFTISPAAETPQRVSTLSSCAPNRSSNA
jgi:hypothetical protein